MDVDLDAAKQRQRQAKGIGRNYLFKANDI